ncbi:MAG: hypothetical protein QOE05_3002 [Actinomycetota bacterium]|nr:hypothetical protein [Actinomycetota bacterium]
MSRQLPVEVLGDGVFYEAPRWHGGRLWVSDMGAGRVVATTLDGTAVVACSLDDAPSGLGWLPGGELLVVAMQSRRLLRQRRSGELTLHADLSRLVTAPLNDMVVDAAGVAYVGSGGAEGAESTDGAVVRVRPDGSADILMRGLAYPNGLVLDGARLVVAETLAQRLTCLDLADESAQPTTWAAFGPAPQGGSVDDVLASLSVAPDGICLDSDGCLWVADACHQRALRVRPGGEVMDEVHADAGVYACALGGPAGRTLLLCTADLRGATTSAPSRVLAVEVGAPRAGLP